MEDEVRHREIDVPGGFNLLICNHQPSITAVLRAVKRAEHGLFNCIASITHDVQFVSDVATSFAPYPLLANLRCGLWYAPAPNDTCYYKSTDGHTGQWSFSTARLNLHVAQLAAQHGGVCIVDATRRGKTFPDALTKTVPIWAAVLNKAILQLRKQNSISTFENRNWTTRNAAIGLNLPSWISKNERNQIEQRLDAWVEDLLAIGADLSSLGTSLKKPLRCIWACQEDFDENDQEDWLELADTKDSLDYTPIVLISASIPNARHRRRLILDAEDGDTFGTKIDDVIDCMYDYVPGAGDDEESWGKGLTPALMWENLSELLRAGPEEVGAVVKRLVKSTQHAKHRTGAGARAAGSGGMLEWQVKWIADRIGLGISTYLARSLEEELSSGLDGDQNIALLNVGATEPAEILERLKLEYIWIPVAADKSPKVAVLRAVPAAVQFASSHLAAGKRILVIAEPEAIDIAAALLVSCLVACFALDAGASSLQWTQPCSLQEQQCSRLIPAIGNTEFSRVTVRQYLAVVAAQYPQVVLSQSLLRQIYNAFLPESMSQRSTAPSDNY